VNTIENKFGRTALEVRRTAVHEAGHAVVGRASGLLCGQPICVADFEEREGGHAFAADPWTIWSSWERQGRSRLIASVVRRQSIMTMAGNAAEIEILGGSDGGDDRYWIEHPQCASLSATDSPASLSLLANGPSLEIGWHDVAATDDRRDPLAPITRSIFHDCCNAEGG
jgi:hypothetical protein